VSAASINGLAKAVADALIPSLDKDDGFVSLTLSFCLCDLHNLT
jgi:hypothetical protein